MQDRENWRLKYLRGQEKYQVPYMCLKAFYSFRESIASTYCNSRNDAITTENQSLMALLFVEGQKQMWLHQYIPSESGVSSILKIQRYLNGKNNA